MTTDKEITTTVQGSTSQQFYQAAATLGRYPERASALQWEPVVTEDNAWQAIDGSLRAVVRRMNAIRYRWVVGDMAGYTLADGDADTWDQAAARAGSVLAGLHVAGGA